MTNALLGVEEGGLKGPKNQLEGKEFPHYLSEISTCLERSKVFRGDRGNISDLANIKW